MHLLIHLHNSSSSSTHKMLLKFKLIGHIYLQLTCKEIQAYIMSMCIFGTILHFWKCFHSHVVMEL